MPLIFSGVLWGLNILSFMLASFATAQRLGQPWGFEQMLLEILLPFLPLVLLTLLAMRWFEAALEHRASRRGIAMLSLLALILVYPGFITWEAGLNLLRTGQPLSRLPAALTEFSGQFLWLDLLIVTMAVIAMAGFLTWRQSQARRHALEASRTENIRLRLRRLQGQLEPHFLFNALNTISALVRGADRQTALAALSRLSDLLRYALRASQNPWLSVQDELGFLHDYLALQQMRFSDRLQVQWQVAETDWSGLACPPLLLQPIIENAVHHGLESHGDTCRIDIAMHRDGDRVCFEVGNPLGPADARRRGHGLGLATTRERLALLYGARGELRTVETAERFTATLCIPAGDLG